ITTYTTISFILIINPDSGPDGTPGSQPDANFQNCVAQLRTAGEAAGGNVKMIGYVLTGYGTRNLTDVQNDVDTYGGWDEAYRPEGIFFDEASTDESVVATYQGYSDYVKAGALGDSAFITLNPGVWDSDSSTEYFSIADLIVTFENTYDNFNASVLPNSSATPLSKQAAIVHTGPTDVPTATLDILVTLAASFYSDFDAADAYENFPTDWTGYLDALVSAQAGAVSTIASTLPSAVLFPLYIYPDDNCTAWAPLFSSITTYTTISFILIINPDSGPDGAPGSQPDANFQNCVAQLRTTGEAAGGNVKMIGYVLTGYGTRNLTDVQNDVDTYGGWDEAYRPEGIFFDEASTDESVVATYQGYVDYVKAGALGDSAFITLNPGVWGSDSSNEYFSIADLIVTFENTYANFNTATPLSQQAAIVHTGPTEVPTATIDILVTLAASFYSDFDAADAYENFPTNWTGYLDALVVAQA
ncbi:hypothetical protein H0H92_014793, partial [Tricholoma furcatifolium]